MLGMSQLTQNTVAQNLFFFFCWACFLAASSFLRLSSARRRSAFSSGVSSTSSSTGVISLVTLCGSGDDGGSAVGDCVALVRILLGEIVASHCEAPSWLALPFPPILKCFLDFFGVEATSACLGDAGAASLVVKTSSDLASSSGIPDEGEDDILLRSPPIRKLSTFAFFADEAIVGEEGRCSGEGDFRY